MRKMKDSNIQWVGQIPINWQVEKNKHCFKLEKNIVGENMKDYNLLSLTKKGVIKKDENSTGGKVPESFETYQSVKKGQMVMCLFDLDVSAVFSGLSSYDGMISPAYKIYNCNKNIYNNYAKYWFQYCFDGRKYKAYSKSLRYVVNTEDFEQIDILLPPREEQEKIANFLDKKVTKIDDVIEKTKETIEDYKKYKQSIITKAVTKGLDKNVEMKDSGVEWIGKIPKNSKVIPLKYLVDGIKDGTHGTHERVTEGELLLSAKNINNGNIVVSNNESYITKEEYNKIVANGYPKKNDILMCCVGDVGKTAVYKFDKTFAFQRSVMFIRMKEKLNYNYVNYYLNSESAQIEETLLVNKNIQAGLYQGAIKEVKIVVHENELEKRIIRYLSKKCNEIDNLISSKEKIIEELEQYKKSLIYEYVTGKKEVKENNSLIQNNSNEIKINCKDNIFAQAILLCKIIEKLSKYNLGRVKAEKTLYLIEKDIGFNFNNNYVREAAGPLSEAIYKCESVISKKNKWIKVNKVKKHIEYEILSDFNKYNKYYEKYYSGYDNQIENIINIIKNYSTDKAEMVATLYASWNDFIIKKEKISDLKIVKDVRENWNDTKKRFDENKWLAILKEMKQIGLIPKGNGKLTIVKEK